MQEWNSMDEFHQTPSRTGISNGFDGYDSHSFALFL